MKRALIYLMTTAMLPAGCATAPQERPIAFVDPPAYRQCPAESAVDWPFSLSWVEERGFADDFPAYPGWSDRIALSGDDVLVRFHASANIHVGAARWVRARRTDGQWTVQTATSPNSAMPPPPPPHPPPYTQVAHQCHGLHFKLEGVATDALAEALDAFLSDGCRAYLPPFIPAPLYLHDANGRGCEDGAHFVLQVETASGVEQYRQSCGVPGASLTHVMRALTHETPENAERMTVLPQEMTVTMRDWASVWEIEQACRAEAETQALDIDFNDPFEW
ncbi:hypothetical protein ACFELO_13355 [Oceanicaulis sp. LC35]|uniref:hypothetical protein n=1 Tax=Oceanicaulis sp. LC35 TaxID=3349635 RepID=UPI003F8314A9